MNEKKHKKSEKVNKANSKEKTIASMTKIDSIKDNENSWEDKKNPSEIKRCRKKKERQNVKVYKQIMKNLQMRQ